jgi:hypothetical protein
MTARRCRAPHHSSPDVGLIGGGPVPIPGAVSRAHYGIRCLEELTECTRHILEVLYQWLAGGVVTVARASEPVMLHMPSIQAGTCHPIVVDSIRAANAAGWARSTISARWCFRDTLRREDGYQSSRVAGDFVSHLSDPTCPPLNVKRSFLTALTGPY